MIVGHVRGHHTRTDELDEHARASWMGKLDARAKIIGVVVFVTVSAMLTVTELIFAALALSVVFAAFSQVPARHLLKAYAGALPFILIASASVFLFAGIDRGIGMWARTSSCVIALLVLASATESLQLFAGLRRLGVPKIVSTLLMLTYKYIVLMADELGRMKTARKARGFSSGKSLFDLRGLKIIGYTAGMVFVRASDRAEKGYEGLKMRGFNFDLKKWRRSRLAAADFAFIAWFAVVSGLLMTFQLRGFA